MQKDYRTAATYDVLLQDATLAETESVPTITGAFLFDNVFLCWMREIGLVFAFYSTPKSIEILLGARRLDVGPGPGLGARAGSCANSHVPL